MSVARVIQWSVWAVLAYWFVYVLVVPVTVWDSHTYNVARLAIAEHGGLFGNSGWNTERQVAFPWTFDAIHYPFLKLGAGFALPSFACLIGLLAVVFQMVRSRYGAPCAWCCCLAVLALPTVVFQASSTKNDLAVVFAVACWVYALWRYRAEPSRGLLALAALALCFGAGAKSSGLPLLVLLGGTTCWLVRPQRGAVGWFLGCLVVGFCLFGSVEIYLNNARTYGHPLGPLAIRQHQNPDGWRGLLANLLRYVMGAIHLGVECFDKESAVPVKLAEWCRAILAATGLSDRGCRPDFRDANLQFFKNGWEAGSDFGPLATWGLLAAGYAIVRRSRRDPLWWLAGAGLGSLLLVSATVAWMPWNMRFLMLPFVLWTLVGTILVTAQSAAGRVIFAVAALFYAVAFPLTSYNKRPADVWRSVTDRSVVMTAERSSMLPILRDLETRAGVMGDAPVLVHAGGDSWVLPILQLRGLRTIPAPQITAASLADYGDQPLYILTLNRPPGPDWGATLVSQYAEPDSALWLRAGAARVDLPFQLTTGWHQDERTGADWLRWNDGRGTLIVVVPASTRATLAGQIFSAPRPNDVTVLLNGNPVATLRVDWKPWEFREFPACSLALAPGTNTVEFVSRLPAIPIANDPRPLAVAVRNLRLQTADR